MPADFDTTRLPDAAQLPSGLVDLLPEYVCRQRWYAGTRQLTAERLTVRGAADLWSGGDAVHRLWWALLEADGVPYQVIIGQRPGGEPAEFLHGRERGVLGSADGVYFYDAALDAEMGLALFAVITGGREAATRVRPVGAEQSNTSLIYDDRVIVKIFRRLIEGPNPDIEVTEALAHAGFGHVAAPVASWRMGGWDLAFAQQYLAGGTEGWALALTSLRDLYNSGLDDPAAVGGDFAAEATRLGRMTGEMHLAMAEAFGVHRDPESGGPAAGAPLAPLVHDIERRLGAVEQEAGRGLARDAAPLLARMRGVADAGPHIRVHGDYHLGQVMRTDSGWYVLDFEGEPTRTREERTRPSSPLKDVTGMLRSFHYASRFALREWAATEMERLGPLAAAWEAHNRAAFLDGYAQVAGLQPLLPSPDVVELTMTAWELDKALYEFNYELAYRPDWVPIPLDAITRLVPAPEP